MNPKDFYEINSLYQKIDLSAENNQKVTDLIDFRGPIDIFCPWCNDTSIFNISETIDVDNGNVGFYSKHKIMLDSFAKKEITGDYSGFISTKPKIEFNYPNKFYFKKFHCTRNGNHILIVFFVIQDNKLFKIGQYPSELDLTQKNFYKYNRLIDKKIVNEVRTSLILKGHNFNVASLIYLRRAYEFMIEECHQIKLKENGWDENKYIGIRNEDKIELLKELLPEKFIKHKSMYGILSKAIHQLEDDECKEAYKILFPIFILIFDEIKFKKESQQAEIEIEKNKSNFESGI
ncbi:MAG TPA: hypothetical protein VIK14_13260 [Ignavibacteria bacterium]